MEVVKSYVQQRFNTYEILARTLNKNRFDQSGEQKKRDDGCSRTVGGRKPRQMKGKERGAPRKDTLGAAGTVGTGGNADPTRRGQPRKQYVPNCRYYHQKNKNADH